MSLALLFHYLMLNMFRMLLHPSSGTCDLFDELFHGLYCSGTMCVGVTLWFGWGGVVSGCRLKHCFSLHPSFYGSHLTVFSPLMLQCKTPYAVIHGPVLLMMDIMMPETCCDRSLIINIGLVASCWFICLHPTFTAFFIVAPCIL